ncbi:flippase-like domain-containing protein [Muricauda sp. SCSIO 64092]|uniref:lysylphosphatidylglycerol synthase transmembrane domain-containing protein n=1 Tax=Allomuricauda sp. SCSIO 64092 TaxID=2908842 RepID=UPI001FF0F305|nr:lysylphosphatidylglycerol synthase transmembrane domain-containing protein [Muricauda sp. SCSIO 64092]UOY09245.1 flippase-like domain-containing protein [Muricauda sp. SCSIO 64092]
MTHSLKKTLKLLIPISLGLFLIWYLYSSTTPEQRDQIITYIGQADIFWVGLSLFIGILSHVSRAIRWNYLLEPLGYKPKVSNNTLIVLIAYLANLGVPRSGEILRATALSTYEGVPFEKGMGTIVTERIIDLIMLFLVIGIALILQTDLILGFIKESGLGIAGGAIILVVGIAGLFLGIRILKKSTSTFATKLKNFLNDVLQGVLSIFKMKRKWPFIFHTFFIWFAYILMFWVIKFTVMETVGLSFGAILVAFVAGAFAMTTTNGGFLAFPIAVGKSLELFGVGTVAGNAFGWIMWIAQTFMVLVFGAISFVLLPLLNRNR